MPYVRSQGLRIHYHVEGDGPPLVCQHGFGDSLESWYELGYVDALKDEYRLVLIDARGHGASDKPHEPEAYSFQNVTADVVAVLDALTIANAHYFGFSMGGKNGFALAAYAPERLRSLSVLGDTAAAQAHAPLEFWIAALRHGPEAVASLWAMEEPVSPAMRQRLVANDSEALIAQRLQRKAPVGFDAILPTLPIPCLLMVGEADAAYAKQNPQSARRNNFPGEQISRRFLLLSEHLSASNYPGAAASVQACSQMIPNATFVSFPGRGHMGSFLHQAEVVAHLQQFLRGLAGG